MSMDDADLLDIGESSMIEDDNQDSELSDMEVDAPDQDSDNGDGKGNGNEDNDNDTNMDGNGNGNGDGDGNDNDNDNDNDDDDEDEDEDEEDDEGEGAGESGVEDDENGQSQNDSFTNGSGGNGGTGNNDVNEGSEGNDGNKGNDGNDGQRSTAGNEPSQERKADASVNGTSESSQRGNTNDASNVNKTEGNAEATNGTWDLRRKAREAVQRASEFDIVPVIAIPYANQCHAVALSEGPKWILTGGEDGFIRKYDFAASIEGKAPLTVAQKHNLMDNISKAGVIGSYWENEQPMTKSQILNNNPKFRDSDFTTGFASYEPKVNPVYSLDVERNGLWCLSGLLSGGISLYTMIYNEGAIHHYFHHDKKKYGHPTLDSGHQDAVSVLRLNHDQTSFLSGSWDKTIREWDLHTGKTTSLYSGSTGQISSVQFRPVGLADLTLDVSHSDNSQDSSSDVDSLFGSAEDDDDDEVKDKEDLPSSPKLGDSAGSSKIVTEDKIFMSSSIDGAVNIWDARVSGSSPVIRLGVPDETPPWCMTASWSVDGDHIYVGRRNSTVEEFSLRMPHVTKSGNVSAPNVSRRLQFPKISGPVSSLSVMPNKNFLFCGSNDNIRLYNLKLYDEFAQESATSKTRATPFYVIPGHFGGVLSNLIVDETGRFLISSSGNRGWGHYNNADVVLVYSIDTEASQQ